MPGAGSSGRLALTTAAQRFLALGGGLWPKRWVVERSFAWTARFRRLAKDCERLPEVLRGLHFLVFAILMLPKAIPLLTATGNA